MLSIQDAGLEILGNKPKHLYFFCGVEYGVKCKYIDHLTNFYNNKVESDSMEAVLYSFKKKQLITTKDSLYVVRYDEEFVKTINDKTSKTVLSSKIPGTIVCIYEDESSYKKLDKYFPENVIRFDLLPKNTVIKYLSSDFPTIDTKYITYIVEYCDNYYHGQQICKQIIHNLDNISRYSKEEFLYSFGLLNNSTEDQFREALAARSFQSLVNVIEEFDGELDYLLNCICNTMVELDKIYDNRNSDSPLRQYVKKWSRPDIYYMFNHTYEEIKKLRSQGTLDVKDSLIYLCSLLRFKEVPSLEAVK